MIKAWLRAALAPYLSVIKARTGSGWTTWATHWDSTPVLAGTATLPVPGRVYSYTWRGVMRFRLVPTTYIPAEDAFYSAYAGGVCAGLLARRGGV